MKTLLLLLGLVSAQAQITPSKLPTTGSGFFVETVSLTLNNVLPEFIELGWLNIDQHLPPGSVVGSVTAPGIFLSNFSSERTVITSTVQPAVLEVAKDRWEIRFNKEITEEQALRRKIAIAELKMNIDALEEGLMFCEFLAPLFDSQIKAFGGDAATRDNILRNMRKAAEGENQLNFEIAHQKAELKRLEDSK